MRRLRSVLSVLVLSWGCAGCACGLLGEAGSIFVQSVGAEYLEYVDGDEGLSADDKSIRRIHVESFRRAVEEARK